MKPFDIFSWQAPGWKEPHPAVIVSHPDRADRKNPIEVVLCSTQRSNRRPEAHEVLLDQSDGLEWPTLCKCDVIYAVPRDEIKHRRGQVALERRAQFVRTIIAAHGWAQVL